MDAATAVSLVTTLRAAASHPPPWAIPRALCEALAASASALAATAAAAARALAAHKFEEIAPLIAQSGHRGVADVLAQVNKNLRSEQRIARASAGLRLGLYGRTRLAHAALCGDLRRCKFLVECSSDPDARDTFLRSPLHEALSRGHTAVVSMSLTVWCATISLPAAGVSSLPATHPSTSL